MVISGNLTSLLDKVKRPELSTFCLIWGNQMYFWVQSSVIIMPRFKQITHLLFCKKDVCVSEL